MFAQTLWNSCSHVLAQLAQLAKRCIGVVGCMLNICRRTSCVFLKKL